MIENRVQSGAETKRSFIEKWDENKLKNLKIEEYSSEGGNNRKDFTYDLEHNTPNIGSIRGGDSSKFKIYKYNTLPKKKYIKNDETYAWYGNENDRSSAFENVKKEILKIVNFAKNKQFEEIEKLNFFGNGIKWKIAFLYAPEGTLVDIFSLKALRELSDKKTIYEIQRELISNKPLEENIYEYSFNLWSQTSLKNKNKNEDAIEEKVDLMNLTKEHILKAIDEFDLDSNMCKGRDAKNWDLIYNGEKYPHKCIVGRAYNISQNLEGILDSDLYGSICEQNCCASKILKELGFELKEKTNQTTVTEGKDKMKKQPLNQILYGSPGTGKTYHTIDKALEIIFNLDTKKMSKEEIENALIEKIKNEKILKEIKDENNNREILKDCFEKYKNAGQIEFVTFHQSYGYEEFVEGIKAIPKGEKYNENGTEMIYKVVPGIFKKLCEKASTKADINSLDFGNPNKIWKMSLGESGSKQAKDIRQYCFDNNVIGLGFWISDVKFKGENGNEIFEEMKKEHAQNPQQYPKNTDSKIESANKTSRIKNEMKEGDIVLISGDNLKTISGIAKVTGKYKILSELREDYPDIMKGYEQVREVEWLVKNIDIPVDDYLEEGKQQLGRGTIISNNTINLQKLKALEIKSNTDKNYILIIDEINRGNISKIFGELITLIEPSKRIVADEEIKVKLPYSGDNFGVPQNLYIIGTMNTADRSIAPIDTALRRRFVFEEMAPNPSLLSENIEGVNLQSLLEAINTRIEYLYDRDHTIGHAYLIDVENLNDLIFAFKNKIIPLLAEYFYEDWENIDLVLNQNGFIVPNNENKLYLSEKITKRIQNKITYKVSDNSTWTKEQFISIYKKIENEE